MSNMSIEYRFRSLGNIADFFEKQAKDERQKADSPSLIKKQKHIATERASVWESAAELVRNATLEELPTKTCATCHAVLADGPQPAATYGK